MQNSSHGPNLSPTSHRQPPGPRTGGEPRAVQTNPRGETFQIQSSPVFTYWSILRLADALTQDHMDRIRADVGAAQSEQVADDLERRRKMARLIEAELFAGHGDCWLGDEEIVRMVQAALQADHGRRYTLRAWSILPNHMQVVFGVAPGVDPGAVVRDWKIFTERQANLATGRGVSAFWDRSTYIRPCADDAEVIRRIKAAEFRPVNAELCRRPSDWPWSSAGKPIDSATEPRKSTANTPPATGTNQTGEPPGRQTKLTPCNGPKASSARQPR